MPLNSDLNEKYLQINRCINNFDDKIKFLIRNYDYHVEKTPQEILNEYKSILQEIEKTGKETINSYKEMKLLLDETRKKVNSFDADIMETIRVMGWDKSVLEIPGYVSEDDSEESSDEVEGACGGSNLSGLEELQLSAENEDELDAANETYENRVYISKTASSFGEVPFTPMVKSDRKSKILKF